MHHFLPAKRLAAHAAGDHNAESDWGRCSPQPHPAAAERGLPAQSGSDRGRVGRGAESSPGSGKHSFYCADQRGFAIVSGRSPIWRFIRAFPEHVCRLTRFLLLALIRTYQVFLSPALPSACRFYPTCSAYAREAIENWGVWRGSWLALRRLARCHPLGGHGIDPVPERFEP